MHGSTSGGPPDADDDKEEDDIEVEDNDEVEDNNKGVSALGLDRDMGFSRGHQTKPNQLKQGYLSSGPR